MVEWNGVDPLIAKVMRSPRSRRAKLRRKWSTIPNAAPTRQAALNNQPSRFTASRLFVSRDTAL